MKKLSLLLLLAVLVGAFPGCSRSTPVEPDPPECPYCSYSWQREDFSLHLFALSDDPEDYLNLSVKYNPTKNLEDASVVLFGYLYNEAPVTWTEADDAASFVFAYIDALHAEIDQLYEEYQEAYGRDLAH